MVQKKSGTQAGEAGASNRNLQSTAGGLERGRGNWIWGTRLQNSSGKKRTKLVAPL